MTEAGTLASTFATSVHCSNNSGQNATVRWRFFNEFGTTAGIYTQPLTNARTATVSTRNTNFAEATVNTGAIFQGMVAVYSTQSGVFCSAMLMDTAVTAPQGIALHMVRYNAHPGTVE